jgi:hypothetical protein
MNQPGFSCKHSTVGRAADYNIGFLKSGCNYNRRNNPRLLT